MRHWVVTLLGLLTMACTARPPADYGEMPPEIRLDGVGLRLFKGSELRAVGQARAATFLRDTGDITADAARIRLLRTTEAATESGDIDIVASTLSGNTHTHQALARGGVRLSDSTGIVATTEQARIDGQERLAQGENPVDIVGPGYRVNAATGFSLDLAGQGKLKLRGPIQTDVETR